MSKYSIRPFRPEDRAAIRTIQNQDRPLHQQNTVAEWERRDARMTGEEVFQRLVVPDPQTDQAIAYLNMEDLGTYPGAMPGVGEFDILVAPDYQRQGIGAMLYARVEGFAQERALRRMTTWFDIRTPDEPALAFLAKRGFAEQERAHPSVLHLATYDASQFAGAIEKAESHGITILSYADVPDTEANRQKLYELARVIERDMPRRDTDPYEDQPYDSWVKMFGRPEWDPKAMILADWNGEWIGLTQLAFQESTNIGQTWITGVLKDHRGKGIATALKVRVMEAAQARGCPTVTTDNHEDNGPMLAINRKMGFVPDPPWVMYNKVL